MIDGGNWFYEGERKNLEFLTDRLRSAFTAAQHMARCITEEHPELVCLIKLSHSFTYSHTVFTRIVVATNSEKFWCDY